MRNFLQHSAHLFRAPCAARPADRPAPNPLARAQNRARSGELFQGRNAFGDLVLLQKGNAQEPEAIHFARKLRGERAQPAFGAAARPERSVECA